MYAVNGHSEPSHTICYCILLFSKLSRKRLNIAGLMRPKDGAHFTSECMIYIINIQKRCFEDGAKQVASRRWRIDALQLLFTTRFRLHIFQKSLTPPLLPAQRRKLGALPVFTPSHTWPLTLGNGEEIFCLRKFGKIG